MTFTARMSAPSELDSEYYADNPFYQSGYGLPNCTCYAWGRFYEISGERPTLSLRDAENWYGYTGDGYKRGQEPKLGAVICWKRGAVGDDSDGAGHVAIVEKIYDDGSILTSNSAYASTFFYTKRLYPENDYSFNRAYTLQGFIYNPAVGGGSADFDGYEEYIWNYFIDRIGNEYAVAGLMGNLYAESALKPNNLQNSYESSLGFTDDEYTDAVDSGSYSEYEFVHDSAGYGLAQWTYWSRKQALYDLWQAGDYDSIGSIELACDYLWTELTSSYSSVLNGLLSADNVREASDLVLHDFENPADQSEAVEELRESYSMVYYNAFSGGYEPEPAPEPDIRFKKKKGFNFVLFGQKRW